MTLYRIVKCDQYTWRAERKLPLLPFWWPVGGTRTMSGPQVAEDYLIQKVHGNGFKKTVVKELKL